MKKKPQKSQDREYSNIQIKEIGGKRILKKKVDGKLPSSGRVHKRGFQRAP